jgi:hypothetical protein
MVSPHRGCARKCLILRCWQHAWVVLADIDVYSKTWGGKVFDAVLPLLAVTSMTASGRHYPEALAMRGRNFGTRVVKLERAVQGAKRTWRGSFRRSWVW